MEQENIRSIHLNRRRFLQVVAIAGAAASCWKFGLSGVGRPLQAARRSQPIMGTVLNITLYGPDRESCEEAIDTTIKKMVLLESLLSRHMESSELARLNRVGRLESPSDSLLDVLSLAQSISRKTAGAFDVTMLPLLQMHESIRGANGHPEPVRFSEIKGLVGYDDLTFDRDKVRLRQAGMGLTLDGIGKGYIVDQGIAELKQHGFHNVYLEAGGDLMVSGHKNANAPWRIGIRPPRSTPNKPVVITVSDKAVATSGDYFQAFTPDLKHHHIINPQNGFSPAELASCTITAPNVALADSLSTAVMVLGKNDGLDLLESMDGCEGYMVDKNLNVFHSTGFFV